MILDQIFNGILIGCMVIMSILIIIAIIRSVIGPATSDRIIAVNMIGTITIVLIAILTVFMDEDYLADVCLVYSMISFVAVVVLIKVYTGIHLEKRGIRDGKEAIEANLYNQPNVTINIEKEDTETSEQTKEVQNGNI